MVGERQGVLTLVSRSSNLLRPRRISSSLCSVFARSVSRAPPFLNAFLSFLEEDLRLRPAVESATLSCESWDAGMLVVFPKV